MKACVLSGLFLEPESESEHVWAGASAMVIFRLMLIVTFALLLIHFYALLLKCKSLQYMRVI